MKKLAALLALAMLALPLAASAQDNRPAQTPPVTHYRFDDHPVPGRDYNANGELLRVRARRHTDSLIRVRDHFVNEMIKAAENF